MEYILILGIFFYGNLAVTTITFASKEACEAARKEAVEAFTFRFSDSSNTVRDRARAICAPRNVP